MIENETVLMSNAGFVGDVQRALSQVEGKRLVYVDVPDITSPTVSKRWRIEEITVAEDGSVVMYVGPRSQ